MNDTANFVDQHPSAAAGQNLDVVDRVSEVCFGLFMALSFVGAVSTGIPEPDAGRTMLRAALGCNLAWGLVDALMYLVRVLADRGSRLALVLAVKNSPNAAVGIGAIRGALPAAISTLVPDAELERVRARMAGAETLPGRPRLHRNDVSNAARIFFLVVLSTFPVALPFALLDDLPLALLASRILTLAMLFGGGFALGRYAGFGAWKAGFGMMVLGVCLTMVIVALGG